MKNKIELKIISLCTLFLLSGFILFGYTQYDDYQNLSEKYEESYKTTTKQVDIYIKSILLENQKKAEVSIQFYTNIVHKELLKAYNNNLDDLEKDIVNPKENSKLVKIIDNTLNEVYINENTIYNKPFVASLNNIIWNRVLPYDYDDDNNVISWNEFANKHYNPELSKKAIASIKNMNSDKNEFIFWEAIKNNHSKHKIIKNMDINEVLKVYNDEGIDTLKSYELLIPVYITKDGDIFGTKDVDNKGHKIENYKIIAIQRVNVYDALVPYLPEISFFENELLNIKNESNNMMNRKAFNMTISAILSVITLVGSAYLQNKFND